jgi:hypothetical protein
VRRARISARQGRIRFGVSKLGRRRLLRPYRQESTASFVSSELTGAKIKFFGSVPAATRTERLANSPPPSEGRTPPQKAIVEEKAQAILAAREQWTKWAGDILPATMLSILERWAGKEKWRVSWDAQSLAINFKIQAGGSDVLRTVEIELEQRLPAPARVIFSNHDEAVVSCPKVQSGDTWQQEPSAFAPGRQEPKPRTIDLLLERMHQENEQKKKN